MTYAQKNVTRWNVIDPAPLTASGADEIVLSAVWRKDLEEAFKLIVPSKKARSRYRIERAREPQSSAPQPPP